MAEPAAQNAETIDIREAHRFDVGQLEDFCRAEVDGYSGNLNVRQFSGGQSNPTFMLSAGGKRYVMRKKPPGTLLASAHQVDREYRVMKALADTDVPVPTMRALCTDPDIIGTEFYIMDFLDGRVLRDPQLPDFSAEERAAIYDQMNDVLARLHEVDYKAIGLEDYGRPGNYYERQIGRWIKQYRAAETETVEPMEDLISYLPAHIPADDATSIAHGDYRLENTMFHATEPKMIAVLDWELSTIGHPLADLAYNCMLYHFNSPSQGTIMDLDYATLGIPSEEAYVDAYCKRTGRDGIEDWDFYLSFSIFRLASITQGVYKRGLDGNASSEKATQYGDMCRRLAETAWTVAQRNR
ncbi:phosphotransferase [Parvibaculaceae bacterium PLY_AMNH_Bact1]|nr:phosphotransferase [Parvibaculaceae bacterium PLY_AMNH_Bact1]